MTTDVVHEGQCHNVLSDGIKSLSSQSSCFSICREVAGKTGVLLASSQSSTGSQESSMGYDETDHNPLEGSSNFADRQHPRRVHDPDVSLSSCSCSKNGGQCITMTNILECFKTPLSEEQAWALIYQFVSLYRMVSLKRRRYFNELEIPTSLDNLCLHRDGTVHCTWPEDEQSSHSLALLPHDVPQSHDAGKWWTIYESFANFYATIKMLRGCEGVACWGGLRLLFSMQCSQWNWNLWVRGGWSRDRGGRNTAIAITVINIINNFNNWPLKAVFEVHVWPLGIYSI